MPLPGRSAWPPSDILFLSDIGEELDAARAAGMQTVWLVRGWRTASGIRASTGTQL